MIKHVARRLRLVLRQPEDPEVSTPAAPPAAELELVAYGEDVRLSGSIRMETSRLTDLLNGFDEYLLEDVLASSISDGGVARASEVLIPRSELLLVHATGPRGDVRLRTRTIERGMNLKVGPYLVTGNVHTVAGMDPILDFRRRRSMVPLTDASIEYLSGDGPVVAHVDFVVVNRAAVEWVQVLESGAALSRLSGSFEVRRRRA
ncbi:MAG: hypothetical protein ABI598_07645 [Chloroflexota bacterium]